LHGFMLAGQSLVCGWLLELDGQRCQPLAQLHNVSAQLAESSVWHRLG
jgi:hypothetical protein